MKTMLAIILAVAVVAQAAPNTQEGQQPLQLSDLISQAQTNINNLATQIQQQLNLPDKETLTNTVREQSVNLVNTFQEYMKNVTEETKSNTELQKLWGDVKSKLSKALDDLNKQLPNGEQQNATFQQLSGKFQEAVQTVVKESENAAKTISEKGEQIQEDIAKFTKQAVDLAVQATQNLNTHLQQNAPAAS